MGASRIDKYEMSKSQTVNGKFVCLKCKNSPETMTHNGQGFVCYPNCEAEKIKRDNKKFQLRKKPKSQKQSLVKNRYNPPPQNGWRCQFCDKIVPCATLFGKDFSCFDCLHRLGLEDHELTGGTKGKLYKQKVEIEEIQFSDLGDGTNKKPAIETKLVKLLPAPKPERKMNLSELGSGIELAPRPPSMTVHSNDFEDVINAMRAAGEKRYAAKRYKEEQCRKIKQLPPCQVELWY